jgi:hypothetical protein
VKIVIVYEAGFYQWKLWDGPDGIDYYRGSAKSLGCAMEQIIQKRYENARYYTDDTREITTIA